MSNEPICTASHELDVVLRNTATAMRDVHGKLAELEEAVLTAVSQSPDVSMEPKTVQQFDLVIQTVSEIGLLLDRLSAQPKPSITVDQNQVAGPIKLETLRMMITGQKIDETAKPDRDLNAGVSLF